MTRHSTAAGELEVSYCDDGGGVAAVLVGGIASSAEFWDPLLPRLGSYRVIRPDLRGTGGTRIQGEDDGDRSPGRFAADVIALADALGLGRFHLGGASMGGFVAQEVAISHPDRVRSLVVACSAHGGPGATRPERGVNRALREALDPGAGTAQLDAGARILFHPRTLAERPEVAQWFMSGAGRVPHSPGEIGRRFAGMAAYDSTGRLPHLTVPTLVISGAEDVLVPPANSKSIAALVPGARLELIPETAHLFHAERPRLAGDLVAAFFAAH